MDSIVKNELKFLSTELIGDIVRFPIWWYTVGLKKAARGSWNSIKKFEERWALGVWVKNIFVPMFGEYDWQGRIISFFMRLIQIIFRSIMLIIWSIIMFILLLAYIIVPVFILTQVLYHWTVVF